MSKRQKTDDSNKDASRVKMSSKSRSWSPKAGKNRTAEGKRIGPAKQRRIDAQREREETNRRLRASGQPTAWEEAKAARKVRRAAMGLPKQERINGRIAKKVDGHVVLVQCCRRCDREAEYTAQRAREDAQAAGARKVRANDQRQKAASANKKIMPPKQIHPKEH
jgi:hypothetical protein